MVSTAGHVPDHQTYAPVCRYLTGVACHDAESGIKQNISCVQLSTMRARRTMGHFIEGVVTEICTPFHKDGSIDWE